MSPTAQHHQPHDGDDDGTPRTLHLRHMRIQKEAHNTLSFVFAYERKRSLLSPSRCGYGYTSGHPGYTRALPYLRVILTTHQRVHVLIGYTWCGWCRYGCGYGSIPALSPNSEFQTACPRPPPLLYPHFCVPHTHGARPSSFTTIPTQSYSKASSTLQPCACFQVFPQLDVLTYPLAVAARVTGTPCTLISIIPI